jgi:hypothetical protein
MYNLNLLRKKESSLAAQEHVKHNKTSILDFSKAEGVVHFSSDYHIIGQQVQAKKNSENQIVENQDKGGEKKTLACRHEVTSSKLGRPGLTGPKTRSDRPIQSMIVGCHSEEKYDIIHIKVPRPSNLFDKVCFASNSQSDPTFSINSSVNDRITNSSKRSIEDGSLLASNSIPSDSTSQCIVKIKKVGHKNTLTFTFSTSSLSKFFSSWCAYGYSGLKCKRSKSRAIVKSDANIVINSKASGMGSAKKGIAEWVDEKSEPFVFLALKPSPQKHRLKQIKYTCSEHGPICHLFELILVIHANTSNGTNHIV